MAALRRRYDLAELVDLPMYFGSSPVQVWRPKPSLPAGPPPGN